MTEKPTYDEIVAAYDKLVLEKEQLRTALAAAIMSLPPNLRGGPTVADPNRPYCKEDQSCCDFTCGN